MQIRKSPPLKNPAKPAQVGLAVRLQEETFLDGMKALISRALKSKDPVERQAAKNVAKKIEDLRKAA